jgi:hypothetical protein
MSDGYIWIGDLSDKHQKAIRLFIDKYRRGAAEHGDLASNRTWTRDMLDESIDLVFYLTFQLLEHNE